MFITRRRFLGASLAGLASGRLLAQDKVAQSAESTVKSAEMSPFQPSTLFLTWQRDPTTTMTIQWVGAIGETADTTVSYSTLKNGRYQTRAAIPKPYPLTDLKVFRTE